MWTNVSVSVSVWMCAKTTCGITLSADDNYCCCVEKRCDVQSGKKKVPRWFNAFWHRAAHTRTTDWRVHMFLMRLFLFFCNPIFAVAIILSPLFFRAVSLCHSLIRLLLLLFRLCNEHIFAYLVASFHFVSVDFCISCTLTFLQLPS